MVRRSRRAGGDDLGFEIFEHTADLGLRVWADTPEALFEEAGRALLSVMVANPNDVRPEQTDDFELPGESLDLLLFDWLNELLYRSATDHVLHSRFTVRRTPEGIAATAAGETVDRTRHQLEHEVKAITYHGLKVVDREADPGRSGEFPAAAAGARWLAEFIVDI